MFEQLLRANFRNLRGRRHELRQIDTRGIKAIPPGLPIPVTIGVTNPVDRLVCPTNDSVGFGALGEENTLAAEYALGPK